jgi:anti-anti-sigma factor
MGSGSVVHSSQHEAVRKDGIRRLGEGKIRMRIRFEADRHTVDGVLTVRLDGALEIDGAELLWDQASQRVGPEERFFLFDFSGVTIITSAGIGTLVRLLIRLQKFGGALAIFGCSDKICEVFDIVLLKQILQVCASEREARSRLIVSR